MAFNPGTRGPLAAIMGRRRAQAAGKGHPGSLLRQGLDASKYVLLMVGFFSFFINLGILAVPLYMLQLYSRVLPSRSESTLLFLTLIVIFVLLAFGILDIARSWVMVRVSNIVERYLGPRVFDAMFERSVFIPGGGHAQGLRDLETLRNFLGGKGLLAFFDAPWAPIIISILFFFHPVLGIIAMAGTLILIMLAAINEMISRKMYSDISGLSMEANNFAEASVRNSEVVKAMGMLGNLCRSWQRKRSRLRGIQTKSGEQFAIIMGIARFVRFVLQILILGVGAYLVIEEQFTPGMMFAAAMLVGRGIAPLEQAVAQWRSLGMARAAYGRLQKLLELNLVQEEGLQLPAPRGAVSVEQLVVAPPGQQEPVLRGVNVELTAGEALGIFGPSGSGKSSLARVLVGVWPPRSGTVRLDEADVYVWHSEQLGPHLGYLPQDVELFDGTVAENIARFGEASPESVIAAAMEAGVHEMILRLPQGYDTLIGEGGATLSGGQRQRIALARALFGQPALVVLDEPNSNLDAEGEQALFQAMKKVKQRGATLVVIAHRPNILGRLDKIMLLRDGVVEAYGPPGQVLQRRPPQPLAAGGRGPQGGNL